MVKLPSKYDNNSKRNPKTQSSSPQERIPYRLMAINVHYSTYLKVCIAPDIRKYKFYN